MLTPKETEAVTLYTTGFTLQQTAHRMGTKMSTVKSHIVSAKRKYQAAGRPTFTKLDLHKRAIEDRLIDPREGLTAVYGEGLLGSGPWSPVTSPTARKLRIIYRPTGRLATTPTA